MQVAASVPRMPGRVVGTFSVPQGFVSCVRSSTRACHGAPKAVPEEKVNGMLTIRIHGGAPAC